MCVCVNFKIMSKRKLRTVTEVIGEVLADLDSDFDPDIDDVNDKNSKVYQFQGTKFRIYRDITF